MGKRKRTFGSMVEMQAFFKETGAAGGKKAAKRMTAAERKARARKAAAASAKVRTKKAAAKRKAAQKGKG
jgi:hypothetical protein